MSVTKDAVMTIRLRTNDHDNCQLAAFLNHEKLAAWATRVLAREAVAEIKAHADKRTREGV